MNYTTEEERRTQYAIDKLNERNIYVDVISKSEIQFQWQGNTVKYFPYKGWASGKTIKDGRGIDNLLKQLI